MRTQKNKIAPLAGKGEVKKSRSHSNAAADQRARLLAWLRLHGQIDTIEARRELDILAPAARVHELRHRFGHTIDLVWTREPTDCGCVHRVGRYVFHPESVV